MAGIDYMEVVVYCCNVRISVLMIHVHLIGIIGHRVQWTKITPKPLYNSDLFNSLLEGRLLVIPGWQSRIVARPEVTECFPGALEKVELLIVVSLKELQFVLGNKKLLSQHGQLSFVELVLPSGLSLYSTVFPYNMQPIIEHSTMNPDNTKYHAVHYSASR